MEYTDVKREMAARAAILYYQHEKNQNEIAAQLGISRSYVSQLLTLARELGIVKITLSVDRSLEQEIYYTRARGVSQAYVLPVEEENYPPQELGRFAAGHITRLIRGAKNIGVNLGGSIRMAVENLTPGDFAGCEDKQVIQMMGGYNKSEAGGQVLPGELAAALARVIGCRCRYINCPAIVGSSELQQLMLKEPSIREVSDYWDTLDLALMGVGVIGESSRTMALLSPEEREKIEAGGAVCDINLNCFDGSGNYLPLLEDRRISASREQLKKIKTKVVVCAGRHKAAAAAAAIKSGMVDVLITDAITAKAICTALEEGGKA
ncbi:MAG: hypothetical protein IJP03_03130 [Christensenellaceae bacterium]|nr:hypothetical protein [Christensenellaceae bacterium]